MAAIAATSYATPSPQRWQAQARLEQARRQADAAEANAEQLRAQADRAEQEAQKGQQNVRSVSAQAALAAQADSTYSTQLRKQVAARDTRQTSKVLQTATASPAAGFSRTPAFTSADNTPQLPDKPWANLTQRPGIGRFVNLSA